MSTTELIQSAVPLPAQTDDNTANSCKAAALRRPTRIEPEQDRGTFFRALQSFHESRNTPITRLPKINGREVDLYLLYNEVINRGGWLKVNIRNEWDELVSSIGFQQRCVNAAVAIKTIYTRYLDKYERLHFLGEDPDKADDLDDDGRPKKWSSKTYNSIPMTYNYKQHELNEEQRNANRMSEDLYKESEYDKLLLSLMSPLPNEQDFAINVCTLMANESKHTLKLDHCPKLLDALLAHAGVFCHYTTRELFQELYTKVRRHSLQSFWRDLLHDKPQILELSFDDYYQTPDEKYTETAVSETPFPLLQLKDNFQDGLNANDEDVNMNSLDFLALGRGLGTQEYIGQRVHQIASIIRNLSFYDENISVLARNRTFVRFLVMGSNIRWGNLHHMVLDVFGNIATELELQDPTLDDLTRCLMSTVCEGIECTDRGVIISCLEILYKVCQQDDNEEHIHKCLNQRLYNTLCLYLSLNDIMLLLYTLEAIYALSSLGHRACNSLVQVKGVINSLMSLITVEAQSYGPDGCILMRVVETVPGNMLPMVAQNIANIANLQNAIHIQQPTQQQEATASGQGALAAAPVRPNPDSTPQQGTKSPNPSNQEHEQFALSWLSATFEPTSSPDSRVEQQELYRMYLSATQKCGRRGIVSHMQFPRMVRTIFGSNCGPTNVKKSEGVDSNKIYYVCLRVRANPLPIQMKVQSPQKGIKEGKQKIEPGSVKKTKKKLKLQEQLKQEQQQKQPLPTLANSGISPQQLPATVNQQQGVVKVEAAPQQQAIIVQPQQPQVVQQTVAKVEGQPNVVTSNKLAISAQVSKITSTQPQIIGNVLLTHTAPATLVQQSATPIKVTSIAEQPQVAQQQIQMSSTSQQQQQQFTQQIVSSNVTPSTSSNGGNGGVQPSSSLIKSLLANKVTSSSTATAITTTNTSATTNANAPNAAVVIDTNASAAINTPQSCLITQNVNLHQVAQRQQKQKELAAQQQQQQQQHQHQNTSIKLSSTSISALVNNPLIQTTPMKVGQTTIKPINNNGDKKVTIISSENSDNSNWDPIPPMVPLSSGTLVRSNVILQQQVLSANDDSSSASVASSVISSSQIEGDGSFASFEGLLMSKSNKTVSTFVIEDDSSKDSLSRGSRDSGRQVLIANQMLVDLLDKKSPDPPLSMKRKHDDDSEESDGKKILLEVEPKVTASKNAANLYAEMAASILEDEDLDEEPPATIIQQPKLTVQSQPQPMQQQQELQKQVISMPVNVQRQLIVNPNNPHQMILSQAPQQTTIPTATATIKTDQGLQTVPVILQKNAMGQQILQPVIQQQQQPQQQTQYVLATNPQGQTYLVAQQSQPQQQTQRLLVTQTPQQQVAGTKTIIILQQQGAPGQQQLGQQQMITTTSQPQKVIMTTPQGQQMIVTQMPRPVQHQIYMNTGGTNVIQAAPMQSHIQMPSQQQIIQKQIQAQNPQNSNILSQLSHIPATIKLHQASTSMITASVSQPITTTATTTSLPRLGKSVSIVQQQGIPPPQTQVTPTVMQAQIVQHTGAPGSTEKRQVIISGGRTIEIADSNQQGPQMVRMIQSPQQAHQQQQKQTLAIQKPIIRPAQPQPQPQQQPQSTSTPAPVQMAVKIPTPPPQSTTTSSTSTTTTTATPSQSKAPVKVKLEPKAEVKVEAKAEIKIEAKIEKVEEDPPVDVNWLFVCDWRNCPRKKFKSIADLHHHSCLVHCPDHLDAGAEIFCQWGPGPGLCDGIPRKRFSLMTHILDRHLTAESLKAAVQRRLQGGPQPASTGQPVTIIKNAAACAAQQQAAESTRGTSSPALSTSSNGSMPSTGSAAMHAIKRHASDFINPKELMNPDFANLLSIETTANTASSNTISMHPASNTTTSTTTTTTTTSGLDTLTKAMQSNSVPMVPDGDENEGPVTKSIRLTAALILRNLVTYTPVAKRTLRQYEPHLASVALSNVESSGTISQILFELNN